MFSNIGKKIQLLALILAGLSFVACAALGALCLISALDAGVDEALRKAGIQAAVISFVLAFLLPVCFGWILYGFGEMVTASKKQADDTKEIRDMLHVSLSEGLLTDEVARKMGQVLLKLQQTQAQQAQAQAPQQAGQRFRAPVQRFVEEPVEQPAQPAYQPAPAQPVYQPAPTQPAYQPAAPAAPVAPVAPAAPVAEPTPAAPAAPAQPAYQPAAPVAPTYTVKPASAIGAARPLQNSDEEAF